MPILHALQAAFGCIPLAAEPLVAAALNVTRGEVHGRIVADARGSGGFGYDPYFFSDDLGRTFGEASREEKERVSHRARAFRALLDALANERPRRV